MRKLKVTDRQTGMRVYTGHLTGRHTGGGYRKCVPNSLEIIKQHQLIEVIRRVLSNTERPNPKPEIPDILERLQRLLRESVPKTLEQTLKSLFDGQRQRQRQPPRLRQQRRDWTDVVCFSCGRLALTLMIREGGSASRVSIHARPRDPGGGTVSTDPRRRTVLHDVFVSVEQPREEPTLVSPTGSTVQTGQASAENTHNHECSHNAIGLYAHKGTMWNTDDRVPQKDIKSPYGGRVLTLLGAAGGPPPAMFPVASALPIDEPQLDSWQVAVVWVDETPAGDSSEQESPCDSQNRRRPMDTDNSLNGLVHTVVQGGPVGPQGKEPLALLDLDHADPVGRYAVIRKKLLGPAGPKVKEPLTLLVLIHADPAGQRAAIQRTTSLWERLPAQPEPPCRDGLVDVEPTVRQV